MLGSNLLDLVDPLDEVVQPNIFVDWEEFGIYLQNGELENIKRFLTTLDAQIRKYNVKNNLFSISEMLFKQIFLNIDVDNFGGNDHFDFSKKVVNFILDVNFIPKYANPYAKLYYRHMRYLLFLESYVQFFEIGVNILSSRKDFIGSIKAVFNKNLFWVESVGPEKDFFRDIIEKEKIHDYISERSYVLIEYTYRDKWDNNILRRIIGYVQKVRDRDNANILINLYNDSELTIGKEIFIKKIGNHACLEIHSESLMTFCAVRQSDVVNPLEQLIYASLVETKLSHLIKTKKNTEYNSIAEEPPRCTFDCWKYDLNKNVDKAMTESQLNAIEAAMSNTLTLIQGPPGTGKTKVAVEIIRNWILQKPKEKVLATADSNEAANKLFEELSKKEINAFRYDRKFNGKRSELLGFNVFVMTNTKSISELISFKFKRVLIDESTQATETSSLVPLLKCCEQLVLIGDHKQLPPTVFSNEAAKDGYNISLFERLIQCRVKPHLLNTQFRMHPSISLYPNLNFYNGLINDSDSVNSRKLVEGLPWPNRKFNVAFVDVPANETYINDKKSYMNNMEIDIIIKILQNVLNKSKNEISVGIITPYAPQKKMIKNSVEKFLYFFNKPLPQFSYQVDTVDGFQGQEKDLIIFSAVRANEQKKIGFVADLRRINVALTRAKRGLIVVGSHQTFQSHESWKKWFEWIHENELEICYNDL